MGMYKEIQKRILDMKREREKWKSAFENISRKFSDSIESSSEKLSRIEASLARLEEKINSLDKAVFSHSRWLEDLETNTHQNEINVEVALRRIEENRQRINDFIKLVEAKLNSTESLAEESRRNLAEIKTESRKNEELRREIKDYVEDILRNHEKGFDTLNNERIDSLEDSMRELKRFHEEIKEKLHRMSHRIMTFDEKLSREKEDEKRFKEYVISHINDVLDTYDSRFSMLKRDIDRALEKLSRKK